MRTILPLLGLSLLVTGCHSVAIQDDVDLDLDFTVLTLPIAHRLDAVHDPYVTGATFEMSAVSNKDNEDTSKWTMTSSNPDVLRVLSVDSTAKGELEMKVAAGKAGTADVIIKDGDGNELRRRTVTVKAPDQAALLSHGPLLIGRPDTEAVTDEARVLVGGEATFLVRWYAGGEELHGNGVLSVTADPGLTTQTPSSFLLEDRDWLQVTPNQAGGPQTIHVFCDGKEVRTFVVDPIDPSQVATIRIRGMDESRAKKGDWLTALADGQDAAGNTLLGIEYSWDVDGKQQQGMGDIYRYEYDPAVPSMLTASFAQMKASAPIHWGGGYVSSSNNIGCSIGRGRPGALWPLALFLGVALPIARRRRRRYAK